MPASDLSTSRDLYRFIAQLGAQHGASAPTLERYLLALWQLGASERGRDALPIARFAELLEAALVAQAPPFDPAWAHDYRLHPDGTGYARWEQTIRWQVVDLHEMDAAGMLSSDLRCFGIDAPRGLRWYNFEPTTFLECATEGTFGGWEPGDPTGRVYVPGQVAVLDDTGALSTADPRTLEQPIRELGPISWDTFAEFLRAGQWYE